MISLVHGLMGEGKTCFLVQHVILETLQNSDRPVYTNVPLNVEACKEYFASKGVLCDWSRLNVVEDSWVPTFWKNIEAASVVVLDELAEFWNSRNYQKTDGDLLGFLRAHRHHGHEVFLAVQAVDHIDKQIRDLCQERIKVINMTKRQFMGFRGPKVFMAQFAVIGSRKAYKNRAYRMDTRVFSLYDSFNTFGVLDAGYERKHYQKTKGKLKGGIHHKVIAWASDRVLLLSLVALVLFINFGLKYAIPKPDLKGASPPATGKPASMKARVFPKRQPTKKGSDDEKGHSYDVGRFGKSGMRSGSERASDSRD